VPLNPQEVQPAANPFTTCERPSHGRSAPSRVFGLETAPREADAGDQHAQDRQPRAGVGISDPVRTPGRKPSTGTALSRAGG
jgi:hypothetical protein